MDLTESIAPKSDQQNYDDYLAGPRTVTVSAVTQGTSEQPVNVELTEYPGRPYKPSKSMRRVLVSAWGADSAAYVGRRITLFGNPEVVYGGKAVGGIEIAALSDIQKPLTLALTATRGKRKSFTVQPLKEAAPAPTRDWLAEAGKLSDVAALRSLWSEAKAGGADPSTLAKIQALATPTPAPDES